MDACLIHVGRACRLRLATWSIARSYSSSAIPGVEFQPKTQNPTLLVEYYDHVDVSVLHALSKQDENRMPDTETYVKTSCIDAPHPNPQTLNPKP